MKKRLIPVCIFFLSAFAYSCTSKNDSEGAEGDTTYFEKPVIVVTHYLPFSDINLFDKKIKKDPLFETAYLQIDSLIASLNDIYPEIVLHKQKIQGDTIFVSIKDSYYLTQELGTDGAEEYILFTIANLTSLPGISFVCFSFPKGDHASPGVYGKDALDDLKIIN